MFPFFSLAVSIENDCISRMISERLRLSALAGCEILFGLNLDPILAERKKHRKRLCNLNIFEELIFYQFTLEISAYWRTLRAVA